MRLLDLFCGAGGCSVGYARAGFDVMGIDIKPQPRYPFEFHQGDALEYLATHGSEFDAIHASPPCQAYSAMASMWNARADHPDLVDATRAAILPWGKPYVIENVPGAPLRDPLLLCGAAFGLAADGYTLRRHRIFESNVWLMGPGCACSARTLGVYGNGGTGRQRRGTKATIDQARRIMGIDWMVTAEISQAIPPAYTEFIGAQLLAHLAATGAAS